MFYLCLLDESIDSLLLVSAQSEELISFVMERCSFEIKN